MEYKQVKKTNMLKKAYRFLIAKIIFLILYPLNIKKKYNFYNANISEMIKVYPRVDLISLRSLNVKLVNIFIILPLFIGLTFSSIKIYKTYPKYQRYLNKVTYPIQGSGLFSMTYKIGLRTYLSVKNQPFTLEDTIYFMAGYFLSIIGAFILSLNPFFEEEERIKNILIKMKKVDGEGYPWKFIFTPYAVFFKAYGCDPDRFQKESTFWNTVNFKPGPPIKFEKDASKFIMPKKYELPSIIKFKKGTTLEKNNNNKNRTKNG